MGKERKAYEIIDELMETNGLDEATLAEKAGLSELVIRNYRTGLNKDSRRYSRLKEKLKTAFELEDNFFSEEHIRVSASVPKPDTEITEDKPKRTRRKSLEVGEKREKPAKMREDEGVQMVFDLKGDISEESMKKEQATEIIKKNGTKKTAAAAPDPLLSAIRSSGSKAKLTGKKKTITPEEAVKWAEAYEKETKQAVGKAFDVLKESLKKNFDGQNPKTVYNNKKITEMVELASKVKDEDLNLIIMMLKKFAK